MQRFTLYVSLAQTHPSSKTYHFPKKVLFFPLNSSLRLCFGCEKRRAGASSLALKKPAILHYFFFDGSRKPFVRLPAALWTLWAIRVCPDPPGYLIGSVCFGFFAVVVVVLADFAQLFIQGIARFVVTAFVEVVAYFVAQFLSEFRLSSF